MTNSKIESLTFQTDILIFDKLIFKILYFQTNILIFDKLIFISHCKMKIDSRQHTVRIFPAREVEVLKKRGPKFFNFCFSLVNFKIKILKAFIFKIDSHLTL